MNWWEHETIGSYVISNVDAKDGICVLTHNNAIITTDLEHLHAQNLLVVNLYIDLWTDQIYTSLSELIDNAEMDELQKDLMRDKYGII